MTNLCRYTPPLLWGWSGHLQTMLFGWIGRLNVPKVKGQRYSVVTDDGSTLYYDLYSPEDGDNDNPVTMLVCPGKVVTDSILRLADSFWVRQ